MRLYHQPKIKVMNLSKNLIIAFNLVASLILLPSVEANETRNLPTFNDNLSCRTIDGGKTFVVSNLENSLESAGIKYQNDGSGFLVFRVPPPCEEGLVKALADGSTSHIVFDLNENNRENTDIPVFHKDDGLNLQLRALNESGVWGLTGIDGNSAQRIEKSAAFSFKIR